MYSKDVVMSKKLKQGVQDCRHHGRISETSQGQCFLISEEQQAGREKPTTKNTKQPGFFVGTSRKYLGVGEVFIIKMQASHIDPDSGTGGDVILAQHDIFCGFTRLHRQTAATCRTHRSLQYQR